MPVDARAGDRPVSTCNNSGVLGAGSAGIRDSEEMIQMSLRLSLELHLKVSVKSSSIHSRA